MAITVFSGPEIYQVTLGSPIGIIDADKIDRDVAALGDDSVPGRAAYLMEKWIEEAKLEIGSLAPADLALANMATRWLVVYLYARDQPEECQSMIEAAIRNAGELLARLDSEVYALFRLFVGGAMTKLLRLKARTIKMEDTCEK